MYSSKSTSSMSVTESYRLLHSHSYRSSDIDLHIFWHFWSVQLKMLQTMLVPIWGHCKPEGKYDINIMCASSIVWTPGCALWMKIRNCYETFLLLSQKLPWNNGIDTCGEHSNFKASFTISYFELRLLRSKKKPDCLRVLGTLSLSWEQCASLPCCRQWRISR